MEWIKRSEQEPDPSLDYILVWGRCGKPHIAFYSRKNWCHTEKCYEYEEPHFIGNSIDFEYWAYAPKGPVENGMD